MTIATQTVRQGDPTAQVSGQHRGVVKYTFTDTSEIMEKNLRAPDQAEWDALLVSDMPVAENQMRQSDAQASSADPDAPLPDEPVGEASNLDILVSKLRIGYEIYDSTDSYRYTNQVDIWRQNKGHSWGDIWNQINAHPEYEMTIEEYTDITDRWQYLNTPAKVQAMQDYAALKSGDIWSNK